MRKKSGSEHEGIKPPKERRDQAMASTDEPMKRKQYEKELRELQVDCAPCRTGSRNRASG